MPRFTDHALALYRNKHGENIPVPPKPRKRDNEESRSQQALISWWDSICDQHALPSFVLFSIPNGGARSKLPVCQGGPPIGVIMKREGLRSGVSDLFLMVKRGRYGGLFVEMKTAVGVPSPDQRRFISEAQKQGYAAGAAYSTADAVRFIESYLRGDEFF